jgi:hypothetical protein
MNSISSNREDVVEQLNQIYELAPKEETLKSLADIKGFHAVLEPVIGQLSYLIDQLTKKSLKEIFTTRNSEIFNFANYSKSRS